MILSLVYVWDMYKFYYPWNDKQFTSLLRTYQLWFPIIFIGMAGSGNWIWEPVWALRTTIYLGPPLCWVSFLYSSVVFHVKYFFILFIIFVFKMVPIFYPDGVSIAAAPIKWLKSPSEIIRFIVLYDLNWYRTFPPFFFYLFMFLFRFLTTYHDQR